jgi:hypothetical protein
MGIVVEIQKVRVCGAEAKTGTAVRIKIGQSFRATMCPAWFPKSCAKSLFGTALEKSNWHASEDLAVYH